MRLRAYLSRLGRETKGIASLEFVLILFPMLFIFFGVIQISGIFYYYHQMQNAARDTARRMATDHNFHPETFAAPTVLCSAAQANTAEDYGCDYLTVPGQTDIAAGYCFESQGSTTIRWDAVVQITVPMPDVSLVDLLGVAEGRTVTATAIMRIDPAKEAELSNNPPFNIGDCLFFPLYI